MLSDFFENLERAFQYIGRAPKSGVELLKGGFPFAVILERLEPPDLIFENCSLRLQYEIFSGSDMESASFKTRRGVIRKLTKSPGAVKAS